MRFVALGVFLTFQAIAGGADWPQFRGPAGQGVSSEKGRPTAWSPTENVVWRVALGGAGTSSPIFVGDRIYLTAYSGFKVPGEGGGSMESLRRHVICLNRKDGQLVWNTDIPSKLP